MNTVILRSVAADLSLPVPVEGMRWRPGGVPQPRKHAALPRCQQLGPPSLTARHELCFPADPSTIEQKRHVPGLPGNRELDWTLPDATPPARQAEHLESDECHSPVTLWDAGRVPGQVSPGLGTSLASAANTRAAGEPAGSAWPRGPRASGTEENKVMDTAPGDYPGADRPREWLALPGGRIRPVVSVPGPGGIAELLAYSAWLERLRPICRCGRPRLGSGRTCGSAECVAELRVEAGI